MPTLTLNDKELQVDNLGFLKRPEDWSEEVAVFLAWQDDIAELTDDHWQLIRFIRSYYFENESMPMIRQMCQATQLSLKQIYSLFPQGPGKGAIKIAGLPRPESCV